MRIDTAYDGVPALMVVMGITKNSHQSEGTPEGFLRVVWSHCLELGVLYFTAGSKETNADDCDVCGCVGMCGCVLGGLHILKPEPCCLADSKSNDYHKNV